MSASEEFAPGIYVKGEKRRRVETRADAVAAKFDGFVLDGPLEDGSEQAPEEDGVNGVGTLGTGDAASGVFSDPAPGSATFTV